MISDQAASDIVYSESGDLINAAMKVRDLAYQFGSLDNISVVVVQLNKPSP